MVTDARPRTDPWLPLWRQESGSFAQLPLFARALYCEVLKLTDDNGVIELGGKSPHEAVAYALGAYPVERRQLKKLLPVLIQDGCLVHQGGRLFVPPEKWARWQLEARRSRKAAPAEMSAPALTTGDYPRPIPDPSPAHPLPISDPSPAHLVHCYGDNPAEPLNVDPESRIEKNRVNNTAAAYGVPTSPLWQRLISLFERQWALGHKGSMLGLAASHDPTAQRARRAAEWAEQQGRADGVTPEEAASRAIAGLVRHLRSPDEAAKVKSPFALFTSSPGRFYAMERKHASVERAAAEDARRSAAPPADLPTEEERRAEFAKLMGGIGSGGKRQ